MADEIEQLAERQREIDERAPRGAMQCSNPNGHKFGSERCVHCERHREPARATA